MDRKIPDSSHVSKAVRNANPHLWPDPLQPLATEKLAREVFQGSSKQPIVPIQPVTAAVLDRKSTTDTPKPRSGHFRAKSGKGPNKTEQRFLDIIEAQKRRGEVVDYRFEGIRLKWGVNPETGAAMHYKPDVVVFMPAGKPRLLEIKGSFREYQDVIRFRGCRAEWAMHFEFEMHVWDKGAWTRVE